MFSQVVEGYQTTCQYACDIVVCPRRLCIENTGYIQYIFYLFVECLLLAVRYIDQHIGLRCQLLDLLLIVTIAFIESQTKYILCFDCFVNGC